jgi:hypothetical protein
MLHPLTGRRQSLNGLMLSGGHLESGMHAWAAVAIVTLCMGTAKGGQPTTIWNSHSMLSRVGCAFACCRSKCDPNSKCLKVECDKYTEGYATVRLMPTPPATGVLAYTLQQCRPHVCSFNPSGLRCSRLFVALHNPALLTIWQVTIKGKKCFGSTPISYIAVSYGKKNSPPVCADNK